MSQFRIYDRVKNAIKNWIIGSPCYPEGDETFAFVYSTGRCGTLHLAKVFGDNNSYVCHEEECENPYLMMEKFLRPIARDNDRDLAMKYVREKKIPFMLRKLRTVGATNYFDSGHQIIFGIVPALLEQLEGHIKFIRLRRDRLQTALSFVTGPEYNDPWMSHWKDREIIGKEFPRWAFRPTDKIVHLSPTAEVWEKLNRFQRYLWSVDEVERQWQVFLTDFSFPYIELQLEDLTKSEYERVSEFLRIGYREDLIGVRHNTTEEKRNRRKPLSIKANLLKFAEDYEEIIDKGCSLSEKWAEISDGQKSN